MPCPSGVQGARMPLSAAYVPVAGDAATHISGQSIASSPRSGSSSEVLNASEVGRARIRYTAPAVTIRIALV